MELAQNKFERNTSNSSSIPFPNGWFCIGISSEVKPGEIKPIYYFDQDLILFRTEKGIPHVFSAHCPHLGAHLGYGGKVKGENIQCPFHGWRYDSDGKCIDVPYTKDLPPQVAISKWSIKEINGLIMMYHAHGKEPSWDLSDLAKYLSNEQFQQINQDTLSTYPQEVCEHSYDIGHINLYNQALQAKSQDVEYSENVAVHRFATEYNPLFLGSWLMGKVINIQSEVRSYGLGISVITHTLSGKITASWSNMVLTTPIDTEHSQVRLFFSLSKSYNKVLNFILDYLLTKELARGFNIELSFLGNKLHYREPTLRDSDFYITKFRQWANQFYS